MRRSLTLLWLGLALLVGQAGAAAGATPLWPASGRAAPRPLAAEPQTELIQQAVRLFEQQYFEPFESADLFAAGIKAANLELQAERVKATIAPPAFGADPAQNWELFSGAYTRTAEANAAQIDQTALAHAVIDGMARSFDECHTYFVAPEQWQRMQQAMRGKPVGVGTGAVTLKTPDGYRVVQEVYKNAPASRVGIRYGDKLLSLDDKDLKGLTEAQWSALIRDRIGQPTRLRLSRPGTRQAQTVTLTPAEFDRPVWETRVLESGVGYLRLYNFANSLDSKAAFQALYRDFQGRDLAGIVLDVRDNGGGSGTLAINFLSLLTTGPGQPLTTEVFRNGRTRTAKSIDDLWPGHPPIAMLANGETASAGEVMSAVAEDLGNSHFFGTTTEGCVASVRLNQLKDGSALGVTYTRVDTFKGRTLNRVGVPPDVVVDRTIDDMLKAEDPQLADAVAWLRGEPLPVAAAPASAAHLSAAPLATLELSGLPAESLTRRQALSATPAGTMIQSGWALLALEEPAPNARLSGQVTVAGWAINTAATTGTGVDEVSFTLQSGADSLLLGTASYGLPRPDVAADEGAGYLNSGFTYTLDTTILPAGSSLLTVRIRSGQQVQTYTIPVVITAAAQ